MRRGISPEFVVACRDALPALETTEAALNDVAFFAALLVVTDALLAIRCSRDDGLDFRQKRGMQRYHSPCQRQARL